MEIDQLIDEIANATERLVSTVSGGRLKDIGAPSLLPGWSRAHVLSHLARNADGLRNILLAARSGQIVRMYPSQAKRDADVDFGAMRPAAVVVDDVIASSRNFVVDVKATPLAVLSGDATWSRVSDDGPRVPVTEILERRLSELEIHHVDLNWGYTFATTPSEITTTFIGTFLSGLRSLQMNPLNISATDSGMQWTIEKNAPVVSGPGFALVGWLTRRTDGAELTIEPQGPLPRVPSLG